MRFFKKQLFIYSLNIFLSLSFAGIFSNFSPSFYDVNAIDKVATFGTTAGRLLSGWSQTNAYALGSDYAGLRTSNSVYSSASYLEANISALTSTGIISSVTIDAKIGGFSFSGDDYTAGIITKGTLKAAFFDSSNNILGSTSEAQSTLTSGAESYTQSTNFILSEPNNFGVISKFRLWLSSDTGFTNGKYMRVEEVKISFTEGTRAVTAISLTPENATITGVGNTQQLTATISPNNATNQSITWTSSDTNVATVNSSGLVAAVATGSATITATTADGSFQDTSAITVESVTAVTSISVSLASATISSSATTQATETVLPAEATIKAVTWSSSNTSIATINSSGLVTANSSGLAGNSVIRATATDGSGVYGEATVTVSPVAVTGVSVSPASATITGLSNTQQLTATITPSNATNKSVLWSSSNTSIATVNGSGLVTSVAGGSVTITVTTDDGAFTSTSSITVNYVALSSITLSTNTATLYTSGTYKTLSLTATFSPANATNQGITWSSSYPSIATVNSSGLVTGLTPGFATITATSNDNNAITATSEITVVALTVTNVVIKTNPSKISFALGENIYSPDMVLTLTYNDSNTADITSGYLLTGYNAKQLGNQTITVTYPGYSGTNPSYSIVVTNVGSATPTTATDLFISEYIEGSSNNKAIEIYNGTGIGVDLSNYKIRVHSNGNTSVSNITLGTSTLASGDTYVISHSSANAQIFALANSTSSSVDFNGDDAVSLYKVSSNTNIDVIGTIGTDPGTAFTGQAANGDGSTLDKTLTRTNNIYQPTQTFKFQEWNVAANDTISNLDTHTFTPLTAAEQSQAYADFLEQFATCTLDGPTSIPTLIEEYNAMTASSKTTFASLNVSDYDNDAYLANGSTYTSLTRTATVNAKTKLDRITSLYNALNPSNTQILNAKIILNNQLTNNQNLLFFSFVILPFFATLIKRRLEKRKL